MFNYLSESLKVVEKVFEENYLIVLNYCLCLIIKKFWIFSL